jgi:prepilin-type N-terminal cleavage/methylation domain-containing protein
MKSTKAFTLIELLVVISIISLLSSVVLASLNAARDKGRIAAALQSEANVYHALADSEVMEWHADEGSGSTLVDTSGNGNNGSYSGGSWTTDTWNKKGSALSFNNAGQASASSLKALPSTEMTVTAWIKIRTHKSYNHVFQHAWTAEGGWILMTNSAGTAHFGVSKAGNIQYNATGCGAQLTTGSWHFLMGVYDGSLVKVYVDGVQCTSGTALAGQALDTSSVVLVGSASTDSDIDELHIYSRAFGS